MNAQDVSKLIELIEKSYLSYFPNGYVSVNHNKNLGEWISIRTGLIGIKEDLPNGYRENDPADIRFTINSKGDMFQCGAYFTKVMMNPPKDAYLVMQGHKIPYRKTTGDVEKVAKSLDKFFSNLHDHVLNNGDEVYGRQRYSNKYFPNS